MFCYISVFWTSISASFIQMQYIWTILRIRALTCDEYEMWRSRIVEESSRSYWCDAPPCCWRIEPEVIFDQGGENFYKHYGRLFPFHKDEWSRLLPRCASSGDGGAEDFSSALRLPSICKFSIFNPEVIINLCSNLSFPSFIVNTGLRVLLRGLNENVKPVQPRHNGDKRLVVERLLLGQMFLAPVAEVLATLDVSPT